MPEDQHIWTIRVYSPMIGHMITASGKSDRTGTVASVDMSGPHAARPGAHMRLSFDSLRSASITAELGRFRQVSIRRFAIAVVNGRSHQEVEETK